MAWKPANETYIVKPDEIKVSSLIPEQFKKNYVETMTGTVIAAGRYRANDGSLHDLAVSPGDRIKFGSKVGAEIEVDGEKLLLVADANVLLVETH